MKTIEFDSKFDDNALNFLRKNYGKRFARRWIVGKKTIAVFVHDEFVLRTSSNQSITVIFEPGRNEGTSRVTVIASGGGDGLMEIDWDSESAAENTFMKQIQEITRNQYSSNH